MKSKRKITESHPSEEQFNENNVEISGLTFDIGEDQKQTIEEFLQDLAVKHNDYEFKLLETNSSRMRSVEISYGSYKQTVLIDTNQQPFDQEVISKAVEILRLSNVGFRPKKCCGNQ